MIRPTAHTPFATVDAGNELMNWPTEDIRGNTPQPCHDGSSDEETKQAEKSHDLSIGMEHFNHVDLTSVKQRKMKGFYEKQNALVEIYRKHLAKTQGRGSNGFSALGPETVGFAADEEEDKEEGGGGNGDNESSMVQSAILLSFASNVVLLVMKGWMAILTGSMSIIASTADSLLDLLSGAVLLMADRAAHKNVNHYEYPEGRSRMEPIGIIIFSTVMCLSSLNILYESLKIVANGYLGEPRDLEVEFWGFVVLFLTIAIKLALWAYCSFVLRVSENKSGSVEAYAQDHLNDVVTNLVAVVCVYAAVAGPSGWWVADPLGAAAISVWIMYSWWDVGKEHVDHLSGRVAPVDFLQQLTFIAANCDELILQVDTVRAFHFGDRFLVEVHVVLDPALPLRAAHDVGEKLEAMVEKLQEVDSDEAKVPL